MILIKKVIYILAVPKQTQIFLSSKRIKHRKGNTFPTVYYTHQSLKLTTMNIPNCVDTSITQIKF